MILKKIFFLFALGLFLSSCQTSRIALPSTDLNAPETFVGEYDTTTVASVNWEDFFADEELISLIRIGVANNADLKVALQRIEMAKAGILAAKGALLPTISADVAGGGRKFGDYTMDGVGNWDTNFSPNIDSKQQIPTGFLPDYYVGLRSAWEVDLWGRLKTMKKGAYHRLMASEHGKNLIQTELIAAIASEYYRLLALDSELAIMRNNIELQTRATETVSNLKTAGRATALAVSQFTAQLLHSKGMEIAIANEIVASENRINSLLGRFAQPIVRGEPLALKDLPEQILSGIPAQMVSRRPDILRAQSEILAAHSELQEADLAFLPTLQLNADFGLQTFKSGLIFNPGSLTYALLGGLTAPLINRKGLQANKLAREAELKESLIAYNQLVINGFNEVITSLRQLDKLSQVIRFKEEEVNELRQAVAISHDLFAVGAASYLEVVTAQNGAVNSEVERIAIKKQQFLSLLQLYRSLGGGW